VTLQLKPVDDEDQLFDYAAEWKIKEIVKRLLGLHSVAHHDGHREY